MTLAASSTVSSRSHIYYWKCDRAAAFHTTTPSPDLRERLTAILRDRFGACELEPGGGQGNHLTFRTSLNGREAFLRVEDGPERDDYIEVESHVLDLVRETGVRTPLVYGCDASRREVSFAWQALEFIPESDLNASLKKGVLDIPRVAPQIGERIARWQAITPAGFGPFDLGTLQREGLLKGIHHTYAAYFRLRLDAHLDFLGQRDFLPPEQIAAIRSVVDQHAGLLQLPQGCLVHKDMALWNVLGTPHEVTAVIDWDDCVSGDPMDDLSLLGCFHDGDFLAAALQGYATVRPLPENWRARFWLHLLRNMIVKSVIRVGAGYFDRGSGFFLIGSGQNGGDLRSVTLGKLETALRGLTENREIESL